MAKRKRTTSSRKSSKKSYKRRRRGYNKRARGRAMIPVHAELKAVDIHNTVLAVNTTGVLGLINGIVQGLDRWNRVGRRIFMKSIEAEVNVGPSQPIIATYFGQDILRFMLIFDKSPDSTAPTPSDILQDVDKLGNTGTDAYSYLNLNSRKRFKVLADWQTYLPSYNNSGAAGQVTNQAQTDPVECTFYKKWFIPINREISYTGVDGTQGSLAGGYGAIYVFVIGANHPSGGNAWNCSFNCRFRYYDF